MTRSVWLRHEDDRELCHNDGTLLMPALDADSYAEPERPAGSARPEPRDSFAELFRRHYAPLRRILDAHREPGLAFLAIGPDGIEASAWVSASDDSINPLVVGRHNAAELFLPSDPELSLRHLAVILHRRGAGPVGYRVLDLRTAASFRDEQGRRLEALEAAGPLLIRCVSYSMLLFPTGEPGEPWPDQAEDAWPRVPDRVYVESRSADPERWLLKPPPVALAHPSGVDHGSTTCVTFPGPDFPRLDLAGAGPSRGEIQLASRFERAALRLGREAVRQGVLIGRYERCDAAGLPVLAHPALSRVHLLVIEVGGALYAIDTASRNGTRAGAERVRCVRLEAGQRLVLAGEVSVEWHPHH